MLRPHVHITVGQRTFKGVNAIEINSTWEKFTDTAEIILPGRFQFGGETITVGESGLFNRGDAVTIQMGYFPTLTTIFTGFISEIIPDFPVRMKCEDITWLLKQTSVRMGFASVTLKDLIDEAFIQAIDQAPTIARRAALEAVNLNFIDPDLKMGSFRTIGGAVSFSGILGEIKKTYGLQTFAQDNNLFIGSPYNLTGRQQSAYELVFERNIIEHDLVYNKLKDIRIKIRAISMLPDNTKLEAEAGDPDGEIRTFTTYNITDVNELKKLANNEIGRFKYEGYRGSLTTFGEPVFKHGDTVKLTNKRIPERDGFYLIDEVTTFLDDSEAYKQRLRLGPKTSETPLTPNLDKVNELITPVA